MTLNVNPGTVGLSAATEVGIATQLAATSAGTSEPLLVNMPMALDADSLAFAEALTGAGAAYSGVKTEHIAERGKRSCPRHREHPGLTVMAMHPWPMSDPATTARLFEGGPGPETTLANAAAWAIEAAVHDLSMGLSAINIANLVPSFMGAPQRRRPGHC